MGRPKGSKNVDTTPESVVVNPIVPEAKEAITDKTFNMAEVQDMVNAAVKKAMLGNTGKIDDTGYWMATVKCQSEIFGCIEPEQIIRLSEDNEKALKLGKYAEIKKDTRTGEDMKITYAHLIKPPQYTLQKIMQTGEERAAEEGLYILPSLNASQSLDDKKPFKLVSSKM